MPAGRHFQKIKTKIMINPLKIPPHIGGAGSGRGAVVVDKISAYHSPARVISHHSTICNISIASFEGSTEALVSITMALPDAGLMSAMLL